MSQLVKYVGLDVHKDTIAVAVTEEGKRAEVREHGEIPNTPAALTKLLGRLGGSGVALHVCYEAGPCGYGIQRQVTEAGHDCAVVARSLIPRRPGDRIKTDRRDAVKLARLHRAGELTAVWVSDSAHEAGRHHQGRERCGSTHDDRGRVELPLSGTDQPGTAPALGRADRAGPGHRLEGARTALPPVSQA